jgi:hypothetical protein
MLPSSPVRVGIMPSNKTLEVGLSHKRLEPSGATTEEQSPTSEEPFTDRAKSEMKSNEGATEKRERR